MEKDNSENTIIVENELTQAQGSKRYSIVKTLGKGAMGVVYLAHDLTLERDVAIKELHANLAANKDLMERFRREAKVLARMAHQGIVQIYDLVETKNSVWIVMEFVKGEDLSAYLSRQGALAPEDVVALGAQIADALEYAHSLGIVHRDLKPANILLTHNGAPKIMDFGLAKLAQSATHTVDGTILGTPAYMSPEQASGQMADTRSDVYSFGIMLYHMATGKVPFTGELASILMQHINAQPKLPKELNPKISGELEGAILCCLEKDPTKRVQDMKTVSGMLKGTVPIPIPTQNQVEEEIVEVTPVEEKAGSGSAMSVLLKQKEKLEQMIKEQYTRYISVMFTDLKGSTAIADLQGNLAARVIIKKHIDILVPIIKKHNGILVKTMGDGTMSYYQHEIEAVRAAVEIQKGINDYNKTLEGTGISLRAGISSGNAFVEENDIFGDVVNVSSRYESACNSGEIYIAEETYEGLKEKKEEYFIRHIKNVIFKGKSEPSRVFKVFYKPDEIENEKKNPTNPGAIPTIGGEAAPKAMSIPGEGGNSGQSSSPDSKRITPMDIFARGAQKQIVQVGVGSPKMTEHKQQASAVKKELNGCIVKSGDVLKLSNEQCRVTGDIIVAKGGVLVLEKAELFFAEKAGIISMGAIRAVNSVFSAIDPVKGWQNVVLSIDNDRIIEIDGCKFCFGRGRTPESLKLAANITLSLPQNSISYGGGLIVYGGDAKILKIKSTSFLKCIANEGGGAYFFKSNVALDGCIFEDCMTKNGSGGGLHTYNSNIAIHKCAFNKCASGNNGGGACFTWSSNKITDSIFNMCMSKRGGGGIACLNSNPYIMGCRLDNCSSTVSGGGIFKDARSNPTINHTSFQKCKPNDIS